MAPITRSVAWLVASIMLWEVVQAFGPQLLPPLGRWPMSPVILVLLVVIPSLTAFAFARLFMASVASSYGSLNPYAVLASPWAWFFWLGLGTAMVGHGLRLATSMMKDRIPDLLSRGDYAARLDFLSGELSYLLLGSGVFVVSVVILFVGQGTGQRMLGRERPLLVLASLATYGVAIVYIGAHGQLIAALAGSVILSGIGLWALPPYELTRDPVGTMVVPGCSAAAVTLLVWMVVAGGAPVWPW